jgi:ribosomal protein S18 acetylase RimI-like enzyme
VVAVQRELAEAALAVRVVQRALVAGPAERAVLDLAARVEPAERAELAQVVPAALAALRDVEALGPGARALDSARNSLHNGARLRYEGAPMPLIVRPACVDDVAALDVMDARIWDARSTPAVLPLAPLPFHQKLPLHDTWVAALDGRAVGYVTLGWRSSLPSNQHVCMIRVLGVDPSVRRQGVALRLLDEAERQAVERRCSVMRLYLLSTNLPARAAYERAGFTLTARLEGEFIVEGVAVDDLIMSKPVRAS